MTIDLPEGRRMRAPRLWTVIDRMIVSDLIKTLAAVMAVIVIILVSRKFIDILGMAIKGRISNETVFSMVALKSLVIAIRFLPDTIFISILLVLGRMYRDHEIDALASAGIGPGQHYRSIFLFIVPMSLIASGLSLYAAPWAEATIEQFKHQDKQSMDIRGISAGKFNEFSKGDLVFFIERIDENNRMHKIFVQNRQYGKPSVMNAESARIENTPDGRYIILENGERIQGQPGRVDYIIENFEEYGIRYEQEQQKLFLDLEAIASHKLWKSGNLHLIAELQGRLATPLGVLLLAALAVPLAQFSPRGGVYSNIFIAFLIDLSYANILRFNQGLIINGVMPAWASFIFIYLLMIGLLVVLLIKLYGKEWVRMRFNQWVAR